MSEVPAADWAVRSRPETVSARDFDSFYVSELPRLVRLARGLCGAALAEDVAQEAMLVTYRRWSHVAALDRPDLWVRRTCANLAVSHFRRRVLELRAVARVGGRRGPVVELEPASEDLWRAVRR